MQSYLLCVGIYGALCRHAVSSSRGNVDRLNAACRHKGYDHVTICKRLQSYVKDNDEAAVLAHSPFD